MSHKFFFAGLMAALVWTLYPQGTRAGGGPENVWLVVNPKSPDSMAIANHYMQLRHIPPGNVVYLPWDPDANTVGIDPFRTQILQPLLETLARRKLGEQIDYVVYSSGFPWLVDFNADVREFLAKAPKSRKPPGTWPTHLGKHGSLTGLTSLFRHVLGKRLGYVSLSANRYMRPVFGGRQIAPTIGFRGVLQFDESGGLAASDGERYWLSTVLAVTPTNKRRGMAAAEAMAYLSRSVGADGTQPQGKIFFTHTTDIRTTQRAAGFPFARDALHKLGIPTEVVPDNMPMGKNNVLGLTCGTPTFSWGQTGSTILPGAICDNLTSFGAQMFAASPHTALTEFLRHGAAGACGTVVEPYLNARLLAKFPSPMIHAHYARGCSLAEAFYQSVHGPYQLLIMGDALCQPFARIARVSGVDIKPGQHVRGTLTLRPDATIPRKVFGGIDPNARVSANEPSADDNVARDENTGQVDHFELFVDGVRKKIAKPGEPLVLDTTKLGDGYHELRIVTVGPAPIFTQGRKFVWVVAANHGRTITATPPQKRVPLGGTVTVTASSPGARRIDVRHNGRTLATIDGDSGSAKVEAAQLGAGFAYLQVVGFHGDEPEKQVFAKPIRLWVE